ncbi:tetratricopeptide repeat protein [bacterium]|nr:tetratricopeptide repeat protein [bacterium]
MRNKAIYILLFLAPFALFAQPAPHPPPPVLFQQGMQAFNNQQYDAAIAAFTKFVNIKPNPGQKPPQQAVPNPGKKGEAYYYIGMSFIKKGNQGEALTNLMKSLELRPDNPQAKLERGKIYIDQKKYDLAVADLTAAANAMTQNEEAQYQLAMAYAWQNNYQQAIDQFKKALAINNRNAYAHYWIGLAYSKINETGQAEEHWRMFLELCPTCPEAPQVSAFLNRR